MGSLDVTEVVTDVAMVSLGRLGAENFEGVFYDSLSGSCSGCSDAEGEAGE